MNTNPDAVAAHETGHVLSLDHHRNHNCYCVASLMQMRTDEYYPGIASPTQTDENNVNYYYEQYHANH